MMARRILIHAAALFVGGSLGVVVGWVVHNELRLDSIFVALIVGAFIFLSQVLANVLVEKMPTVPQAISREAVIRGTEPWGWLKPASGIGAGFPLNKECIRLGRGVDMDILLNNASISRRHAQIRRLAEGCLLEDIGSRNGIFVNGTRVTEQTLNDGDQVGVGEMKFVFVRVGPLRVSLAGSDGVGREDAARALRTTAEIRGGRPAAKADEREARPYSDRDARPFDDTSEYDEDDDERD